MPTRISKRGFTCLAGCILFVLATQVAGGQIGTPGEFGPSLDPDKAIHHYVREIWTMEDGLPSNTIRDIVQTPDGYLWLATRAGLVRFDGVRFKTFDTANTSGLPTNFLTTLCLSRDGTLWIGSGGGLVRYREGQFSILTRDDGLAGEVVEDLLEDRDGVVWVVAGGQAHRLEGDRLSLVELPEDVAAGWVNSVAEGADGTFWFTTRNHGLIQWQQGQWRLLTTTDGLLSESLSFAYQDRSGALWIAEPGPGVARLSRYIDGRFTEHSLGPHQVGSVRAIHESRDGTLWIAFSGGVRRISDGDADTFSPEKGGEDRRFLSLYEDREGSLWMGTYSGGLQRFTAGPITTYSDLDGVRGIAIAIYEDRDQILWVGTPGGLSRYEGTRFVPIAEVSFPVRAIGEDEDGALWLGSRDALIRYSRGGLERFPTDHPVNLVFSDPQGGLLVGLWNAGIQRFVEGAFTDVEPLKEQRVRWVHEDRLGVLWFGTQARGLLRMEEDRFAWITTKDGLSSDALLSYHEDDDGTLWIGTNGGGLNRLGDGVITTYTSSRGLHDDSIWPILEDDRENLWMGGDRGIFRVSKQHLADFDAKRIATIPTVAYGLADGLKDLEGVGFGDPSGVRTHDGRLWVATMGGVAMIDPSRADVEIPPPSVVIEEMLVDGLEIALQEDLEVPADSRELEIRFTALSLHKPKEIQFEYQLEDFDKGWHNIGTRRMAFYTNVPPGSHRFRVRARHAYGEWSAGIAELGFTVLPAWWQTWWWRASVGLAMTAFIVGFVNLRLRAYSRRQAELEKEISQRKQAEIEILELGRQSQAQRDELAHVQRIAALGELTGALSHEISQPLTAIRSNTQAALRFLDRDDPDLEEIREILADIDSDDRRAADILRNLRGLLQKQSSPMVAVDINDAIDQSVALLHGEAAIGQIVIDLDLAGDLPPVRANPIELQQVMVNLLVNAFDSMAETRETERRVIVQATSDNGGGVRVSVCDTGHGLGDLTEKQLFTPFQTTKPSGLGIGLSISRTIIETHGGRIWAENNPDRGATFHFTLPSDPELHGEPA